jgi:PAS domain S-box-containing protein
LQRQINKHLTKEYIENPLFKDFIQAVNQSYQAFERDQALLNHAFKESEIEYHQIHDNLKKESELKKQSIANLYRSIEALEDSSISINNEEIDDLLFISKYLNEQIEGKKAIERELVTTVELFKKLLANLQSGILVEDENRKILFTNELFCSIFGIPVSPDAMIGMDCTNSAEQSKELFKDSASFSPRIDNILESRTLTVNELLETVDGRFLERDYIPIFLNEEYKGHLWKYTDVTQRIKTQNLLEQSEERNRLIMNSALNAIITINTKGIITFWNNQAEVIYGWKSAEVVGKSLTETIIPNQHKKGHDDGMKHYIQTGEGPVLNKQLELPSVNKEGREFPVEISIIPIRQNDELFFCSFIQDISERKEADRNLRFQEEKYRNIIANMNLGLIEVNNEELIEYANQSFSEISGFEISELMGKNPSDIFVFGENNQEMERKKELRKQGVSDIYQIPVKNKRGELRWWAISGAPNFDDKGNLVGSIGIHLDITEQKQLEQDLEREKVKAEEASKAKEAFLANMSHEIRTPLNAIIGFLRELSKQELTQIQKKYIENSSIASKHLLAVINNILDVSKIEAGEMSLENEDFILENSIKNVLSVLQPKAIQKGILLTNKMSNEIAKVLKGDSLRVEQILFNLVGNALKFTNEGFVEISCQLVLENHQTQRISISIKDSGIGMDKQYVDSIFRKFSQEDKTVTRKFGGTGLGMAITKELVHLMNGKIEVNSEKNIGTTIRLLLEFDKGSLENVDMNKPRESLASIDGTRVLLVEDNELNRLVAQNSLKHFNCIVSEAENGAEALELLKKQNYDVILMDIQMPEMDGIEATKIIRNEFLLQTPIIALTANAFKTEIEKCKNAGMNDYITKPFDESVFVETIARQLTKSKKYQVENHKAITQNNTLYNLSSLNNLSRGNTEFVQKMISIFVEQTTDTIQKIEKAIAINHFEEVFRLTH